MRIYFNKTDLTDELLGDKVTDLDIAQSSKYVEAFALTLGVSADSIARPTPFMVSELAKYYALVKTALRMTMMVASENGAGPDAYELKRRIYADAINKLEKQITAQTLMGKSAAPHRKFPSSVPLYRN